MREGFIVRMRLELVPLPTGDTDRAVDFYVNRLGFQLDVDVSGDGFRFVQLTPPGSSCSVSVGYGVVDTAPGSVQQLHLVVDDIEEARAALIAKGVGVQDIVELTAPGKPSVFVAPFTDPDGNGWTLQQLPY